MYVTVGTFFLTFFGIVGLIVYQTILLVKNQKWLLKRIKRLEWKVRDVALHRRRGAGGNKRKRCCGVGT